MIKAPKLLSSITYDTHCQVPS